MSVLDEAVNTNAHCDLSNVVTYLVLPAPSSGVVSYLVTLGVLGLVGEAAGGSFLL